MGTYVTLTTLGKWIAFDYHSTTPSQIYLIDFEGRNLRVLASGNYDDCVPSWSRDGRFIYFASNRSGQWQTWKRELETGRETQVTRNGGHAAFEGYEGRRLYYPKFEGGKLWSMPFRWGAEERITDALHRGYWGHFAVTETGDLPARRKCGASAHDHVLQLPNTTTNARASVGRASPPLEGESLGVARRANFDFHPVDSAEFPRYGGELSVRQPQEATHLRAARLRFPHDSYYHCRPSPKCEV